MGGKLIYEELSYKLRGVFFGVHNEIGQYRNEKQYCDAIEFKLKLLGIKFQREFVLPISFDGERKGRSRVDFLVENKVIIEVKCVPCFSRNDYFQSLRYLVSSGKDLLLLVNFHPKYCHIKRILNPNLIK